MTRYQTQSRINLIKKELENRHKYNTVKLANSDGKPIPVDKLQTELYFLIYKLSKNTTY